MIHPMDIGINRSDVAEQIQSARTNSLLDGRNESPTREKAFLSSSLNSKTYEPVDRLLDDKVTELYTLVSMYPNGIQEDHAVEIREALKMIASSSSERLPKEARNAKNIETLSLRLIHATNNSFQPPTPKQTSLCSKIVDTATGFCCPCTSEDFNNKVKIILENVMKDFFVNAKEVSKRIHQDKMEIQETFFPNHELADFSLTMASEETHHKGKTVGFVKFNNDDNLQVVYKPRDLRIDGLIVGNNEANPSLFSVINSLNEQITNAALFYLPSYSFLHKNEGKKRYGYTQFIPHNPTDCVLDEREMENYYQTMGATQCLAQALGITDLHRENMNIYLKKPCPIDLEASFDVRSILSKESGSTGLAGTTGAINSFGSSIRDENEDLFPVPTQNKVQLIKNNELQEMPDHYKENYMQYIEKIESGFDSMKYLIANNNDYFRSFVNQIPDDIEMRFIPASTAQLKDFMQGSPNEITEGLCALFNSDYPESSYKIHSKVKNSQVAMDVLHWDVPRMTTNMHGEVYYNGKHFLNCIDDIVSAKLSTEKKQNLNKGFAASFASRRQLNYVQVLPQEPKVKKILLDHLDQVSTMKLDDNFKASLRQFFLYQQCESFKDKN